MGQPVCFDTVGLEATIATRLGFCAFNTSMASLTVCPFRWNFLLDLPQTPCNRRGHPIRKPHYKDSKRVHRVIEPLASSAATGSALRATNCGTLFSGRKTAICRDSSAFCSGVSDSRPAARLLTALRNFCKYLFVQSIRSRPPGSPCPGYIVATPSACSLDLSGPSFLSHAPLCPSDRKQWT